MVENTQPTTGPEWMRWVERRLTFMERHRHPGSISAATEADTGTGGGEPGPEGPEGPPGPPGEITSGPFLINATALTQILASATTPTPSFAFGGTPGASTALWQTVSPAPSGGSYAWRFFGVPNNGFARVELPVPVVTSGDGIVQRTLLLRFDAWLSSEFDCDVLRIWGTDQGFGSVRRDLLWEASGTSATWTTYEVVVPANLDTLYIEYRKDVSDTAGIDEVRVSNLRIHQFAVTEATLHWDGAGGLFYYADPTLGYLRLGPEPVPTKWPTQDTGNTETVVGTATPTSSDPDATNLWVDTNTAPGVLKYRTGSIASQTWTPIAQGQAEAWFSGAGAPSGATGLVGDWYLNLTNGDVWEKTGASTWTLRGNIKGPQGDPGPAGSGAMYRYLTANYTTGVNGVWSDVTGFSWPVVAGTYYALDSSLFLFNGTAGSGVDIKFGFHWTGAGTMNWGHAGLDQNVVAPAYNGPWTAWSLVVQSASPSRSTTLLGIPTSIETMGSVKGTFHCTADGQLDCEASQGAANATAGTGSVVRARSWMRLDAMN